MTKKHKNGSEADSENTPQPERIIRHHANRELVTFLGNLVVEAKQHHIGLQTLYEMARDWGAPAPRQWGTKLIDEEERHIERTTAHLSGLKVSLGYAR